MISWIRLICIIVGHSTSQWLSPQVIPATADETSSNQKVRVEPPLLLFFSVSVSVLDFVVQCSVLFLLPLK